MSYIISAKYKSHKNIILFILLGFLVFSPLSSTIIQDYLNFPISMPELLFAPFVYFLRGKLTTIQIRFNDIVKAVFLVFVLLVIGILFDEFTLFSLLSNSRSWLYLLICMYAFSKSNSITNEDLMWMGFGSVIAWFVNSSLNYQRYAIAAVEGAEAVTYGLMLAVPIFLASAIYKSRYLLLLFGISVISITVVFAGVRRLLVVALLSLFVSVIMKLAKSPKQLFSFFIMGLILSSIFVFTLPLIRSYVAETSPIMYYRVFERTSDFIETGNSGSTGDESRLKNFSDFADDILEYTIPHGMVSLQTRNDTTVGVGKFIDFPLYQLSWIFGWPIAFFLLYRLFKILSRNWRIYMKNQSESSFVSVNCITIMFSLLFLEGSFLAFPYATPITGLLIGKAILNQKKSLMKQ